MFPLAEITIGRPDWLWVGVGVAALAVIFQLWRYGGANAMPAGSRMAAGALRVGGVLLLCACLLDVQWTVRRAKEGANAFAILADRGRGMQVREAEGGQTRAELSASALRQAGPAAEGDSWQATLESTFEVRRYTFGERLESVDDFEALEFDGGRSDLGAALRVLERRYRNRPIAGILVLSDGNATDLRNAEELGEDFFESQIPIFPVVVGGEASLKDLAIAEARVSQTVFEDAPVNIEVDVRASKFAGKTIELRLRDEEGKEVEKLSHEVGAAEETHRFRLRVKPEKTGVLFYELELSEKGAGRGEEDREIGSDEATAENNRRLVMVERPRGPYRVLYVSGRPNWEYKYLRRALTADSQVEMVGLMRVAKREPKFEWRGRAGESSNPLFRGFGKDDPEEGASYDKPVLVRLNTQDAAELSEGFPREAGELFAEFEAIIVDDLEAAFFTSDQMQLIEEFVSRRGGGFIMLGGQESFRGGDYEHTPIAQVLPVYLDPMATPVAPGELRLELTKEGWLEPWLRLRGREEEERQRMEGMAPFHVVNQVRAIKPGASILATVIGEGGTRFPAAVAQRYGEGRVLALTIGDVWRWGARNAEDQEDMAKAWRQMARWAMADVPRQVMLSASREVDEWSGQSVRVESRVRDREFEPLENARVEMTVTEPGGGTIELVGDASLGEAGLYESTTAAARDGGYRVAAIVRDENGDLIANEETGWTVDSANEEFRRVNPNRELMEALAARSGGKCVSLEGLEALVAGLPGREAPVMDVRSNPLWHTPWIFLIALVCFAAEWALRRREGLV